MADDDDGSPRGPTVREGRDAFRALVAAHQHAVHAVIAQLLLHGSIADVEDLAQETFLRVHGALPRFEGDSAHLKKWIVTIAARVAIDHLRRKRMNHESFDETVHRLATAGADELAQFRRLGARIEAALVELRYDDGTFGCNSPACWPAPSWALIGNGGLVSTVDDLARWNAAIDDGTFFAASTRDVFRRDVLGTTGLSTAGEPAYLYSGRNDFGFGAAIAEVPSRGTSIIVAANAAASFNDSALTIQLLQMALGALVELE